MLLKILLFLGIITFVLYKLGSFFFKIGAASQHLRNVQEQQKKARQQNSSGETKKGKFNGGEYIDYEEVK